MASCHPAVCPNNAGAYHEPAPLLCWSQGWLPQQMPVVRALGVPLRHCQSRPEVLQVVPVCSHSGFDHRKKCRVPDWRKPLVTSPCSLLSQRATAQIIQGCCRSCDWRAELGTSVLPACAYMLVATCTRTCTQSGAASSDSVLST